MLKVIKEWTSFLNQKMEPIYKWVKEHQRASVYLASALVPMLIMLVVWAKMEMYPFGSKSLMAVDFSHQYISFYGFLKNAVLTGDWTAFSYSFTKSLGGEMIGILSYYLMSPFNIIYILLPLKYFPLGVFLTIWLRYGVISWSFAYLLVKRYKGLEKNAWMVPLFSTAYTLSGMLVSYQMNTIFYDAMFMLPLVIVALEEMLDGNKPYKYMVLLAATMFMQFYLGYMVCIFIALYACYYMAPNLAVEGAWKVKLKHYFQPLLRAFCFSIVGIGLASVLLYPVVINLMQSKGQVGGGMAFAWALQINPLDILSKLMIGGFDTTSGWSAGPNLPNIYVGALGLLGFFFYFAFAKAHKYQKIGAGLVTLVFFISFVHEFTSKIWHMGQNPAGFFYRFSWILSFFMVLLAFQAFKERVKVSWKGVLLGLAAIGLAGYYVSTQDYTYIAKKQPEVVKEYLKTNSNTIYILLALLAAGILYYIWKKWQQANREKFLATGALLAILAGAIFLLQKGYLLTQVTMTMVTWTVVLLLFAFRPKKLAWTVLAVMTILELGYNAYLSQVTLGYADAYKFSDATVSVKRVVDTIKENNQAGFYRIGGSFAYSRTSPTLLNFPGLSTFSSSLERTTMDHFAYMGDYGINASTQYANGTLLTDALYGVRYYMDIKDYDPAEATDHPERQYFTRLTTRKDIAETFTEKVYEDSRYLVYENPDAFSVAFGTGVLLQNITFGYNNPVSNQNLILNTMMGEQENVISYFQAFSFTDIQTENLTESQNEAGETVYKVTDQSQPGIVRYKAIPKSSYTYYFLTPNNLKEHRDKVSILLNGQWLPHGVSFAQKQLWQIAANAEGQEVTLEFRFTTDQEINMSDAGFIRADNDAIKRVLAARKEQSMKVTKWTNTQIAGTVNITDDSSVMMTSIPYSPGWIVKVDGKEVATKKAWDTFLSFPITAGKHKIVMTYVPSGLLAGAFFSLISLAGIVSMLHFDRKAEAEKDLF